MAMNDQQAAEEAQFSAGYDGTPTETPAEVKPEEKQEPAAQAADPVDPLKELMSRFEKLEQGHNKLAGHIGGIQRSQQEIQAALATAQAAAKTTQDAPTQAQVKGAAADPKEWENLKEQYPEWATATEKLLESRLPANFDAQAFEAAVDKKLEGKTAAMQQVIIDSSLSAIFPGWKKEIQTSEFAAWMGSQPDDVKALSQSSDVGDAAQMLKLYDAFKRNPPAPSRPAAKPDTSTREKRLAAAVAPRGTGGHSAGSTELDEFEAGYSGRS